MDIDNSEARAKEEALKYVRELYDENMWISGKYIRWLESAVERDGLTADDVQKLIASKPQSVAFAKRMFVNSCRGLTVGDPYFRFENVIFPVGSESVVTVLRLYRYQRLNGRFRVVVSPYYDYAYSAFESFTPFVREVTVRNGRIEIPFFFDHEDMYTVSVFYLLDDDEILIFKGGVYALEEDLYGKQFYKADLHIHTTFSDGVEAPELVVASARECGMDIIAVTDHNSFDGSLSAIEKAKEFGLDLTVLTGVEYAMSYSPMHILHIGADRSVSPDYLGTQLAQREETQKLIEENRHCPCDAAAYACTQVLLDEIEKAGGISVLAHPYWKPIQNSGERLDTPENLFVELAKLKRFTGYEIVSGSPLGQRRASHMQASLVNELAGGAFDFPILGITDSHHYTTDGICGKHYTIIISDSKDKKDVLEALRKGQCVAVDAEDDDPLCYGNHRLNKLALFLISNYFPERDRRARLEAMTVKEKYVYDQ